MRLFQKERIFGPSGLVSFEQQMCTVQAGWTTTTTTTTTIFSALGTYEKNSEKVKD